MTSSLIKKIDLAAGTILGKENLWKPHMRDGRRCAVNAGVCDGHH
jgi:hypothetical protein